MSAQEEVTGESFAQAAWQMLRDDIISGKLAPQMRLRIAKLRNMYGVGASPLREALSRLVADKLVISLDRRGFVVAPMSLADFRDLTDARKLLEKATLRLSLQHGDDGWESRIIAAYHQMSKAQQRLKHAEESSISNWEMLNEEFHEALVAACPSSWLLSFRRIVYAYTRRYQRICLSIVTVSRDVQAEHRKLCDAALARNVELSLSLIDEHLERTFRKVESSGKLAFHSTSMAGAKRARA